MSHDDIISSIILLFLDLQTVIKFYLFMVAYFFFCVLE